MSYQQIGFFAYGKPAQNAILFLIFILTWLAAMAYLILMGDLLVPPICYIGGVSNVKCSDVWFRRSLVFLFLFFYFYFAFLLCFFFYD